MRRAVSDDGTPHRLGVSPVSRVVVTHVTAQRKRDGGVAMSHVLSGPAPSRRPASPGRPAGFRRPAPLTRRWVAYALLAPAAVLLLVVQVIPIAVGIWMSTVKLTQFYIANWRAAPFAGLSNYRTAIDFHGATGASLLKSFLVTCAYTFVVVGVSWLLGMIAAVALQRPVIGRGAFRTIFLIPYAVPVYAGIISWKFIFQKDTGALNHILADNLGLISSSDKPFWLLGANAFVALCVAGTWPFWPFSFLMLMAGMQSIPSEMYEASAVDGASWVRQWRSVTLPMLRPVNTVLILILFLWVFNDFNTPFILFGTAEPPAGDLISFHIYSRSFLTLNFGLGAAMSTLLVIFLLIVTGAYLLIVRRRGRDA